MCDRDMRTFPSALPATLLSALPGTRIPVPVETNACSRRRRLWELPTETHCPIVGVCLPLTALRRLVGKALGSHPAASDYEIHVAAVSECAARRPIAEAIQRELDRRYAPAIRRFAQAKSAEALTDLWLEAVHANDVAQALWATLTHPRCDVALRERVCHDVHMFQHQTGARARADLHRLAEMQEQNRELQRELAAVRERGAQELERRDQELALVRASLAQGRGRLIAREAEVAHLQAQLAALEQQAPELGAHTALLQELQQQRARIAVLERERAHWQRHAQRLEDRMRACSAGPRAWTAGTTTTKDIPAEEGAVALRDKSVLCVGGRPAAVPVYRQLVECSGARFLHHDGGAEDSAALLESNLATADLVICQTGCVSHGAYWRVKDYCKRTGKQCVFVEKPSASSLARCLRELNENDDEPNA